MGRSARWQKIEDGHIAIPEVLIVFLVFLFVCVFEVTGHTVTAYIVKEALIGDLPRYPIFFGISFVYLTCCISCILVDLYF